MSPEKSSYNAESMTILEGLAHVRKRPGMYIGGTGISGLHHLVWEVVDNSVDEAMAGYCDRIDITILADGACRVVDNGRGIPTDVHPEFKLTGVEIALTKLGGGGKFGGDGYKVSGGLHGVGVSVVNAMSEKVVVEVDRNGKRHRIEFLEGGAKKTKLEVVGDAPRGRTGTSVTFWPDTGLFESTEFVARTMLERFQMMAFLNKGLEIRFKDERPEHDGEPTVYKYAGGIVDFVKHVNATKTPLFSRVGYIEQSEEEAEVELAFQWNEGYQTDGLHSFANGIATIGGGTHEEGFRAALTTLVNKYARAKGLSRRRTTTSAARTCARASPASSRCACASRSSRARPRTSSATPRSSRWCRRPPTRSWPTGSRRTRPRPTRS
jgi:DNA gyrase subunit B